MRTLGEKGMKQAGVGQNPSPSQRSSDGLTPPTGDDDGGVEAEAQRSNI